MVEGHVEMLLPARVDLQSLFARIYPSRITRLNLNCQLSLVEQNVVNIAFNLVKKSA